MSVKTELREALGDKFGELKKVEIGSDIESRIADSTVKMVDRYVEMEKLELEQQRIELEEEKIRLEQEKLEAEKKAQKRKDAITTGIAVGSGLITTVGTILMVAFEGEKSITTRFGSKMLDRIYRGLK